MKKIITIQLKMSEIIYDIQNKTYLTGRSSTGNAGHSHIANMQANDDEENAAQILRSITGAYAALCNRLSEYTKSSETTCTNDSLTADDDLILTLEMPSNFNTGASATICSAAHQFIVATAIADWFSITAKGETIDYYAEAGKGLTVIEEALAKRLRPNRG